MAMKNECSCSSGLAINNYADLCKIPIVDMSRSVIFYNGEVVLWFI